MNVKLKKNVLITGSNGFIAKNLIKKLEEDKSITIYCLTRESSTVDLEENIRKCDFIFHLAGEVKPNSSESAFKESNTNFTQQIISTIESIKNTVPIVMISSIHAQNAKNAYGITKRESEIIIETYSKKHNIPVINLRLPHVFGEECKPNHNSVITTWIYNSINNIAINVFNRDIQMKYVYVQDVIHELVLFLNKETLEKSEMYRSPNYFYEITLGELIDSITEIKNNTLVQNTEFKKKLINVYDSYRRRPFD